MNRRQLKLSLLTAILAAACFGWPTPAATAEEDSSDKLVANPRSLAAVKFLRERRKQEEDLPVRGEVAPDFHLKLLKGSNLPEHVAPDAEGRIRLSDYAGKKPVVLIFGSYT